MSTYRISVLEVLQTGETVDIGYYSGELVTGSESVPRASFGSVPTFTAKRCKELIRELGQKYHTRYVFERDEEV